MNSARRRFLKYLAASPLLAGSDLLAQQQRLPDPSVWAPRALEPLIGSPQEALSVFDFEPVMHKNVRPAHFGYMATGIDDEVTLRANREDFLKFQLLPRRLVDVTQVDLGMELFGQTWGSPIVLAPTGSNKAFHEDGEIAVARAARRGNHLQILSTVATTSIEQAIEARGRPVWFQLYPTDKWQIAAGPGDARREGGRRHHRRHRRRPGAAELGDLHAAVARRQARLRLMPRPGAGELREAQAAFRRTRHRRRSRRPAPPVSPGIFIKRLRDTVKTRLVLKGLMTAADAILAVDNGLDGIIVSNHGGRGEDSGRSTIDALPEIVEAVDGRIPVLVDSGLPPRHRHRQGAGARRARRVHRPALSLGPRRLRPGRRRARALPPAAGDARRHAAGRRALAEADRSGAGAAGCRAD